MAVQSLRFKDLGSVPLRQVFKPACIAPLSFHSLEPQATLGLRRGAFSGCAVKWVPHTEG